MSEYMEKLAEPFPPEDVEWRIGRAGKNNRGIWAKVLAYITNRAIMERLDDVFGPQNWKNDYREGPSGGVLCGIAIRVEDEWVWKWDGAENTEIESVKGGLSGAMKRAAVQWGVGRYLYNLDEGWADVHDDGERYGRLPKDQGGDSFHWDPPALPEWAKPGGKGRPTSRTEYKENVDQATGEITAEGAEDAAPQVDDEDLPDAVREKLDTAAKLEIVDVDRAANIEGAIEREDLDILRVAHDWLDTQIAKRELGGE